MSVELTDCEIDFVAGTESQPLHIQGSYLLATQDTVDRVYGMPEESNDNHPKLVLSLDPTRPVDRSGIRWQSIVDLLLMDSHGFSR